MTAEIKIDETGLITDLDAAKRNRNIIAQMRQAEQVEEEGRKNQRRMEDEKIASLKREITTKKLGRPRRLSWAEIESRDQSLKVLKIKEAKIKNKRRKAKGVSDEARILEGLVKLEYREKTEAERLESPRRRREATKEDN